ncbi:MAG TPA: hypothetical protein VK993_06270 [Chthoniobacterales bacterium]|nr:hypothetical protein [Chthoniobacterales bacterium]
MNSAIGLKLTGALQRVRSWEWILTLLAIYTIHHLFVSYFILGNVTDIVRPFSSIPAYVYTGWDGALYRNLYNNYDRYYWPPLYPFALRLVTFVFDVDEPTAFEKSALILNFISHIVILIAITRYVRQDARLQGVAPWLIALLLFFFPFHNVFFAAYSESFYLAITILALVLHQNERVGAASLLAGVASLTRMMGSFLALAFFLEQLLYCIRDRTVYWRKLLFASFGIIIFLGWHTTLRLLGTTAVASNADWISDLLVNHVPEGANPKLWVLKYLAFSPRYLEVIAFWMSLLTVGYCAVRKRYVEMFYIGGFYLSLAFYLYRPFAWTRYVSVLFPIQIMLADWLRAKPRLAAAMLVVSAGTCYFIQRELFQGRMGEP